MSSRLSARHRFEDDDDDDFIPQAPKRSQNLEKAPAGDKGDFIPKAPKKTQRLKTSSASYSGGVAVKGKPDDDMEPDKAKKTPVTSLGASSATKTSAIGLVALASTSVTHSTGMARASNAGRMYSIEEEKSEVRPHARVGAVVVRGLSSSDTSAHSAPTYSVISNEDPSPPRAVQGEDTPLQATLVADPVASYNEEADIEAQMHARMRSEAEDIADMVHSRIFRNTAMAAVNTNEDPTSSATKSEGDNRRKKKCILLALAVLLIAGAIGVGVGITSSNSPPDTTTAPTAPTDPTAPTAPTDPTDPTEAFRGVLDPISGELLDDPNSPQCQALRWIANEDPANITVGSTDIEIIKQRYVAAVLYFALGGENWINKCNFLTGNPICSWNQELDTNQEFQGLDTNQVLLGIICDSANVRVEALNMSKNGLRGSIPEEIGYFSDLTTIEMTDGLITGTLPSSLAQLNLLSKLDLTACELEGTIPEFLYTHAQLMQLILDENSFTGTIPSSLGTSSQLWAFWVMNNKLTGSIPASVGQSSVLSSVDLPGNSLTGTIPEFSPSSQMFYLSLANNTLDGSIPSSIGNLQHLQAIVLSNSTLGGTIPTELGQCQVLRFIAFEFNQLSGDIGPVINMLPPSLTSLGLYDNRFSGTVPTSIGMLTNLEWLHLGVNNLNGTIPTELGLLSNLEVLGLQSNRFTGTVPASLASLPLTKLDIFDNDLTGSLDALCSSIVFDWFAANICGQDEISCTCCTHCCELETDWCNRID